MEEWIFDEDELKFVAGLLVDCLDDFIGKGRTCVFQLILHTFDASYEPYEDFPGHNRYGLKISDVELKDGTYLHDHIVWDFNKAVWDDSPWGQMRKLDSYFWVDAEKAGYMLEQSCRTGKYSGDSFIVRKKSEFLSSFDSLAEKPFINGKNIFYEKQMTDIIPEVECQSEMKCLIYKTIRLWRIPAGTSTGKLLVFQDAIYGYVFSGEGLFESGYWQKCFLNEEKTASWHEFKDSREIKKDWSFNRWANAVQKKRKPKRAWISITNTGSDDLILYFVSHGDQSMVRYPDFPDRPMRRYACEKKLTIYSYQHPSIMKEIEEEGYACCKVPEFAMDCENVMAAYEWMSEQMIERIGKPLHKGIRFPLWGWYQEYSSRKLIKTSALDFGDGDNELVLFKLSIPKSEVLLSDFNGWHFPLNAAPLYYTGKAGRRLSKELDKYPSSIEIGLQGYPEDLRKKVYDSWNLIFDLDCRVKGREMKRNMSIQATFWEIRKEWIVYAKHIKRKSL